MDFFQAQENLAFSATISMYVPQSHYKKYLAFYTRAGGCFAEQHANSIYLCYLLVGFGVSEWVVLVNCTAVFLKPDHALTL